MDEPIRESDEQSNKTLVVRTKPEILSPEALRNPATLAQFIEQPPQKIAQDLLQIMTGVAGTDPTEIAMAAGRIAQAAVRRKARKQAAQEIKQLMEKGKIKPDFANHKFGLESFADLLEFIDNSTADEDRLDAVKAMFWGVNRHDAIDGERILDYQLFQISKKLSGSQLLVLRACNDLRISKDYESTNNIARAWAQKVAALIGHKSQALVERDEAVLMQEGLITARTASDKSGIHWSNARLTDLGIAFCERIVNYEKMKSDTGI